jgi:hypothetical protein
MASTSLRYRAPRPVPHVPITSVHLLLLGTLSVGAATWGWFLISGRSIGDSAKYLLLLGLYGAASAAFIFSRVKEDHLKFFDIPVFLTILMFVEFGLAPVEWFIAPEQLDDSFAGNSAPLLKALIYVIAGMAAFWVGCIVAGRNPRSREQQAAESKEQKTRRMKIRILGMTVAIYAAALAGRLYLLTHQLYSYLGSSRTYFQNLASVQILMVVSDFGTYALVIACIEKYLNPRERRWKLLFAMIFASECFWGLLSGVKGAILQNFVLVALVSSLIQRRFRKGWVIAAVLGVVVLYPASDAYRGLVRGGEQPVTSFAGAAKAGITAMAQANRAFRGLGAELLGGLRSTLTRLDLLQEVGWIVSMGPSAGQLPGSERWWMLPFYPFVPRFLWHSKPVLLEGGRFSVALGYGGPGATPLTVGTSTAVTYPGDLYARGGLLAILAGMFLLGIAGQRLTSKVSGAPQRQSLFLYAAIFLTAADMEMDAFSYWSTLLKTILILSVTAWFVYGPRYRSSKGMAAGRGAFARP